MLSRYRSMSVTFVRPFKLDGLEQSQPAGDYLVEIEEELLQELSFPAYRRVGTWIRRTMLEGQRGHHELMSVDSKELDDALARDAAPA